MTAPRSPKRTFTADDQTYFAQVSGDYNPMHMDALQARRTQAGAPVVHGIHLLLWALNQYADKYAESQLAPPPLQKLRAHFNKFVYLNEPVELVLEDQKTNRARLSIAVDGSPRAKLTLNFGEPTAPNHADSSDWESLASVPFLPEALNLEFEQMASQSGRLSFAMSAENAAKLFPAATKWLGPQRIAALAASTHLVGMICPGLHSIYSELTIQLTQGDAHPESLGFRVSDTDPRFRSVQLDIRGGGLIGVLETTARTPPVQQASISALASHVLPGKFSGTTALIVGGSRGLGELAAKLLAVGGTHVILTWKSGREDAERVVAEIRTAGASAEAIPYDASQPAGLQLATLTTVPTHAYYFATPAIFRPQAEIFSTQRLQEFMAVYVDGFWQLAQALRAVNPAISLFYPSSVAATERPAGMTEYTMAKLAGETLAVDMNSSLAPLHVTINRLPRLATDQTATVAAVETASAIDVMLPILEEVQSWPR